MDHNNTVKQILPFDNPENSSFFWHEIKRFPTLSRLFVSNLTDNKYGELPEYLINPINDLGILSLTNLTWIDNVLALLRISNNNLTLDPEELDITELVENTIEYLKPLLARKGINIKINSSVNTKQRINNRYTRQVMVNSLLTIIDCLKDNAGIDIEIFEDSALINFKIKVQSADINESAIPDNLFDPSILYVAQENHWAKHSLDLQTARFIAETQNGSLILFKTDSEYIINYSLKPV